MSTNALANWLGEGAEMCNCQIASDHFACEREPPWAPTAAGAVVAQSSRPASAAVPGVEVHAVASVLALRLTLYIGEAMDCTIAVSGVCGAVASTG